MNIKIIFKYFVDSKYLIRFLPTLKQSFLWYSHCLFPVTFHREIKIEKYSKFINLSKIIIQDYCQTDLLWNYVKDKHGENDMIENKIHEINECFDKELLICGVINNQIYYEIKDRYYIPMEVFNLIIKYYGIIPGREYEKRAKPMDEDKLQQIETSTSGMNGRGRWNGYFYG